MNNKENQYDNYKYSDILSMDFKERFNYMAKSCDWWGYYCLKHIEPPPKIDISTKRSPNQAPFVKISKSGDGGGSGDCLDAKGGSLNLRLAFHLLTRQ
jgi:hypothetical protein